MRFDPPPTITTPEWWSIDGQALNKYGWNVSTVGGSRYGVPATRGSDARFAYVPGAKFRPKLPDSRVITLQMWVLGVDPDTGDQVDDSMLRWNDSWNYLRRLFWQPSRLFTLTRRWLLTGPDGNPAIRQADAQGYLGNTLDLEMTGRFRGTFQVDIVLPDPFFYGVEQIAQVNNNAPGVTVANPGDFESWHNHLSIQLVGPLSAPIRLTNNARPAVTLAYSRNVDAGETVTLDCSQFLALSNKPFATLSGVNTYNRVNYVDHDGSRQWMELARGDNLLSMVSSGGSGHAVVRFQPPYV